MSFPISYSMKKKSKMAKGGEIEAGYSPKEADESTIGGTLSSILEADGGDVSNERASGYEEGYGDSDMVNRIMKKRETYSKGGEVANDTPMEADFKDNDFDDLAKDDDLEFKETAANSGDEDGDAAEDKDRKDIVSRIMSSRKKKDKNPRPA